MERSLLALALVLALTLPASAAGCCEGYCHELFRLGTPETPAGQFYVVEDVGCQPECYPHYPSLWFYEESNGIDGLQRLDEINDETCGGQILPDTLMF